MSCKRTLQKEDCKPLRWELDTPKRLVKILIKGIEITPGSLVAWTKFIHQHNDSIKYIKVDNMLVTSSGPIPNIHHLILDCKNCKHVEFTRFSLTKYFEAISDVLHRNNVIRTIKIDDCAMSSNAFVRLIKMFAVDKSLVYASFPEDKKWRMETLTELDISMPHIMHSILELFYDGLASSTTLTAVKIKSNFNDTWDLNLVNQVFAQNNTLIKFELEYLAYPYYNSQWEVKQFLEPLHANTSLKTLRLYYRGSDKIFDNAGVGELLMANSTLSTLSISSMCTKHSDPYLGDGLRRNTTLTLLYLSNVSGEETSQNCFDALLVNTTLTRLMLLFNQGVDVARVKNVILCNNTLQTLITHVSVSNDTDISVLEDAIQQSITLRECTLSCTQASGQCIQLSPTITAVNTSYYESLLKHCFDKYIKPKYDLCTIKMVPKATINPS